MSRLHDNDTPVSSGMVVSLSNFVYSQNVVYGKINDKKISGYLSMPSKGASDLPGIILIHEWWGLNDNIRNVADQFAEKGFVALAVDMYEGKVADSSADARKFMSAVGKAPDSAKQNIRQAFTYLKEVVKSEKIGVIGWCFGGGWSLQTSILLGKSLDACVIYYGRIISDKKQLSSIQSPILGIFGGEDRGIPADGVKAFEQTLKDLNKTVSVHIYEGAGHAFANPSGNNYQDTPAKDAWSKTLDFFSHYLKTN
ncbi:MAG TPA: dienelactone hydrolase family protein [Candidatus Marinimicrobia bacterium]|nr:dienelactone hydrolase family protein [Candidatus Neomarinimicrobiota bacterium]HIB70547.1 dienelactone hydrolase family protein [Candidatus Neomarinimicrobiota bacterium]